MSAKTEREVLLNVYSKTHGKTVEELEGLLYEKLEGSEELTLKTNSEEILSNLDATRISSIKSNADKDWEAKLEKVKTDQKGKVKKDTLTELEASLKEKFEIEAGDKKGIELIEAIITANTKSTLTPDEIKRSKEFRELETRMNDDYIPKDKYTELETEFKTYKTTLEQTRDKQARREAALKFFNDVNPSLSKDANRAEKQKELFLKNYIDPLNTDMSNPNDILLLDNDGKRIEDIHGNPVTLKIFVENKTKETFDILVQPPGGGSGNNNNGNSGQGTSHKVPETISEFNDIKSKLSGKENLDFHNKYCERFELKPIVIPA